MNNYESGQRCYCKCGGIAAIFYAQKFAEMRKNLQNCGPFARGAARKTAQKCSMKFLIFYATLHIDYCVPVCYNISTVKEMR